VSGIHRLLCCGAVTNNLSRQRKAGGDKRVPPRQTVSHLHAIVTTELVGNLSYDANTAVIFLVSSFSARTARMRCDDGRGAVISPRAASSLQV
jgi:hypothetical protein